MYACMYRRCGEPTFDASARPRLGAVAVLWGDELGVAVLRPIGARAARMMRKVIEIMQQD
jgi:hypothetical protein